jgi:hypothetical protein
LIETRQVHLHVIKPNKSTTGPRVNFPLAKMKFFPVVAFIGLAIFLMVSSQEDTRRKNINIQLKSSWLSTSLIAEASEFLAEENQDLFWKFVELTHEQKTVYYS